jgi:amino acid permease
MESYFRIAELSVWLNQEGNRKMAEHSETGSSDRLRALGYEQGLRRNLSVIHVVGLAMADVSPTMAVMLLTAGCFVIGGTFAIGANILLAVVVMLIALCLGELASMYPLAGGMYSLVDKILPKPLSWITAFNYLLQGIVIPASIALGIGVFLRDLLPGITWPDWLIALIVLAAAGAITLTRVEIGAWATLVMVVVEIMVLGIVTVAAFMHPQQNLADVIFHPVVLSGGALVPVALAAGVATLAPAFNVINGYDASLGFAEELRGHERDIGKAVLISAFLASFFIIVPLIAAVVAAPDLKAFLSDPTPVVYSVQQSLGSSARVVVDIGVIIALFNATVSLFMYFSRGFYATGRDGMWPPVVSRKLARTQQMGSARLGIVRPFRASLRSDLSQRAQLADHLRRHHHRRGLFLHWPRGIVESDLAARRESPIPHAALAAATADRHRLHRVRLDRAGNAISGGRGGAHRNRVVVLAHVKKLEQGAGALTAD